MAVEPASVMDTTSLGRRVVEAARLAVAVHLFESLSSNSSHYGRRIGIGGAGPFVPGAGGEADVEGFGPRDPRAGVPATDGAKTHAAPPFDHADDGEAGSK
jgi:hypothetical protein